MAEAGYKRGLKLDRSPSKIMRFSAFFVWGGRVFQEGIAVDTLLVWCGRSITMLIFFKMANSQWGVRREVV
jgi:hypothetical protein